MEFLIVFNNIYLNNLIICQQIIIIYISTQPHPRPEMIDKKVVDGHVISDQVVFTASAPTEEPYETLAFDDNIKVTISFFKQGEGKHAKSEYTIRMNFNNI